MLRLIRRVLAGLSALVRREQVDQDLNEEVQAYLETAIERHMNAGLGQEAASRAAHIEMGSVTAVKQETRAAGWESRVEDIWQDARYAIRTLRRSPGFTAVAVLTLALAIGANTAVFSIVNGLMLRALPVAAPEQLALVSSERAVADGFPGGWNFTTWEQIATHTESLGRAVAWSIFSHRLDLAGEGEADPVDGLFVSGNFFQELGVLPVLGRAFTADEDRLGRAESRVAVISYGLWQRRFGGSDVVGRSILVHRVPVTIVGVAPPAFLGPEVGRAFDIALPIGSTPLILNDDQWGTPAGPSYLGVMLRLPRGQPRELATAVLRSLQRQIIEAAMPPKGIWGENQDAQLKDAFVLVPAGAGTSELRRQYSRAVVTVLVIASLVLLIACANIANLLMARGAVRRRELSLRLALGAPPRRLIQQLLVESLILSATGAGLGLLVAAWASDVLVAQMSTWFDRVTLDVSLDWRVVSFAASMTIATALLFGLTPAFRASRLTPVTDLKDTAPSGHGRSHRWSARGGLVAAQVALSLLLVIAAGLFIRTFDRLLAVPLGFDSDRVLVVEINASRTPSAAGSRTALYHQLASSVAELPGVEHAGVSINTPANHGVTLVTSYTVDGMPEPRRQQTDWDTIVNYVTPGWFRAYGLPIRAGRVIETHDTRQAPLVAVANEAFARKFFPGRQAVGGTIVDMTGPPGRSRESRTIIGVVGNVLDQSPRQAAFPSVYLPLSQWMVPFPEPDQVSLSVKASSGSAAALARTVAGQLLTIDRRLSFTFRPLEDQIDAARHQERLIAWLSTFFGALALLLAAIGLFGIASSAVVRRRTEIGIRMALGAQRGDVVRLALRQTILATVAGLAIGLAAAALLTRYLETMLFGITPLDPVTFVAAPLVLAIVALIACVLPARRATAIDPMVALRCE
jgi:putative ABC transport system permease protein